MLSHETLRHNVVPLPLPLRRIKTFRIVKSILTLCPSLYVKYEQNFLGMTSVNLADKNNKLDTVKDNGQEMITVCERFYFVFD